MKNSKRGFSEKPDSTSTAVPNVTWTTYSLGALMVLSGLAFLGLAMLLIGAYLSYQMGQYSLSGWMLSRLGIEGEQNFSSLFSLLVCFLVLLGLVALLCRMVLVRNHYILMHSKS